MKNLTQDTVDNIDHMIELLNQQIGKYRELQRALLIADLLGVPPKEIKEPLRFGVRSGREVHRPWVGAVISLRVGDGPYEDFAIKDVDIRLWPDDMRQAYERWQKVTRRQK